MTAQELRAAIAALDITQVEAAGICGVGERTFRSWVLDEVRPPWSVAVLFRLMLADRENLKRAQTYAEELIE